jgi:predicted dehydrogenase
MKDRVMRVGIVGAGRIAAVAARTLSGLKECEAYAIGSRSKEKAEAFAAEWHLAKAYGSYAELIADADVDLLYIATPHSHHYDVTHEALLAGKPCLVEKSFMANYWEAKAIVDLARERKVFLAEAIWTRYQPAVQIVKKLIDDGRIGDLQLITATLCYPISQKPRIMNPELCGGSLLDLGIYCLHFARMFCPSEIVSIGGHCVKSETGVDQTNTMLLTMRNGVVANMQSSVMCVGDNRGILAGSKATIVIDDINNPQRITLNTREQQAVEDIRVPQQITGYEYEFLACRQALIDGLTEPREISLDETLYLMQLMDTLRQQWGVRYPMDK